MNSAVFLQATMSIEIRGLAAVGVLVVPVAGDGDAAHGNAGLCVPELGVAHKAAHNSDSVQHNLSLHIVMF